MSSGTTALAILLDAFDGAGGAEEESLACALRGVTPAEAEWQPPGYPRESEIPGLPPPGTILWHIAHLAHCARHYAHILRQRPVNTEPQTSPPRIADLGSLVAELESSRSALRREIARVQESELGAGCARQVTVSQFILMAIRHETWHAGQVMVVRRLVRRKDGA